MIPLVREKMEAMVELCRQFGIERLCLFGSAVDGRFDPNHSDLDFLVSLPQLPSGKYADTYLDFAVALERLLGRPVDLVTERSIRNPYFRETVETTRETIYDRRDEKAVA
jgi:predicted nucleotidyltransferase